VNDVGLCAGKAAEFIVPFAANIVLRRKKSMLAEPFRLITRLGVRHARVAACARTLLLRRDSAAAEVLIHPSFSGFHPFCAADASIGCGPASR
jgi:hypothetical protein